MIHSIARFEPNDFKLSTRYVRFDIVVDSVIPISIWHLFFFSEVRTDRDRKTYLTLVSFSQVRRVRDRQSVFEIQTNVV